ncbi:hypothetical protein BDF14DRAFT_954080 [Spinellus fusiger]|nr:hypothetical protein BDF14DRAFT_954080 [Spinellus fusiger]
MTIKGKGMWRMLKKERFKLYLLNEFKTSSLYPECKFLPWKHLNMSRTPGPINEQKCPKLDVMVFSGHFFLILYPNKTYFSSFK